MRAAAALRRPANATCTCTPTAAQPALRPTCTGRSVSLTNTTPVGTRLFRLRCSGCSWGGGSCATIVSTGAGPPRCLLRKGNPGWACRWEQEPVLYCMPSGALDVALMECWGAAAECRLQPECWQRRRRRRRRRAARRGRISRAACTLRRFRAIPEAHSNASAARRATGVAREGEGVSGAWRRRTRCRAALNPLLVQWAIKGRRAALQANAVHGALLGEAAAAATTPATGAPRARASCQCSWVRLQCPQFKLHD